MCKTIKQRVKFRAEAKEIYALFVDAKKLARLTGRKAIVSGKVGGRFSLQGGRVTGINVDLVPERNIVRAWRTKDFPAGVFSMAALQFVPRPDGGTEVTLTHRGVPKELIPKIETEWRDLYWRRIRALLT